MKGVDLMRGRGTILILIAVAMLVGTGCPPKPIDTEPAADSEAGSPPDAPSMGGGIGRVEDSEPSIVTESFPSQTIESAPLVDNSIEELNAQGVLKTIYFEYDQSELDEDDRMTIQENVAWLENNTAYNVVIEGHCDERGTIEYNLALGDRRAKVVRDYMRSLGMPDGRMRVVTWGEERPEIERTGEAAWSRNRRAEFILE